MPVPWFSRRMIGAHVLGVILLVVAVYAGTWQWGVYQAQRDAAAIDLTQKAPIPVDDLFGPDDPYPGDGVGRPVTIEGQWLPESTLYVSGREHEGEMGNWVVTSVAVGDAITNPAIPVVRGWIADLNEAPPAPTGPVELTAWMQPTEGTLVSDDDPTDDVLPQMRMAYLIQHVDQDLYGGYAVSQEPFDGMEAASLTQLPESGGSEGLRNMLYAIEWWFFGGFAIFIWWRFVLELRHPEADDEAPETDPSGDGADPEATASDEAAPNDLNNDPKVASAP